MGTGAAVFALFAGPILPSHAEGGVKPKRIFIGQSAEIANEGKFLR